MYCPRCGAPSEKGAKYCAACGAGLPGAETSKERRSARERLTDLIGTNRKARTITGLTALAIVAAVVALIVLKPSEDESIPRDAYTVAADNLCVEAKREIATSERHSLRARGAPPGAFAQNLVPIVSSWRSALSTLEVPSDRIERAEALDAALREVEIGIAALARVADEGDRAQTVARAGRVDKVTSKVEVAIADLGLSHCARLELGATPAKVG
ncbi:MAG TPA: zinc ribbon domain-containing protein [Solirubrobacterales bacterium]|nr:zinc ribbon domain-containing protein [Solirubrobacterales bacterium]